ncbi:MAG: hypothetical protein ACJ794_12665 [Gemmatimonadaceae bacterium]
MRWTTLIPRTAVGLLLTVACADPEGRLTAPKAALATRQFSDWSTPVSLGSLINSSSIEQQPNLTKDGLTLYFTSGRPTDANDLGADLNIWVAQRACTDSANVACAWQQPQVLGPEINGEFADVTPALSRDEHLLIFSSQRARENCTAEPCDRDLWVSYRDDVHDDIAWQSPVHLGPNINGSGEDLAPNYFENDDGGAAQLFFTRGQLAAADLYVSYMQSDGSWGPAIAISELNTAPNGVDAFTAEARPSVSHNGLELYFWSNRTGIAQIYHTSRESVTAAWSSPTLVPSPIAGPSTQQPFIYSHGNTETLLIVRGPATNFDLYMSERTRDGP